MLNMFAALAMRTVTEPREAATEILSLRLERSVLWSALALAVVLNSFIYQLSLQLTPTSQQLPLLFSSPIMFAVFIGAGLVLSVYSLTFAGRFIGGNATLESIMALLVWLQFLRFAVQLAALVLMVLMPAIAGLLVLGATLYGMYLLLHFVDVAHEFNSLFSSFGALVLSALGIMLGLAILLSLFGVQNMGLTPYV